MQQNKMGERVIIGKQFKNIVDQKYVAAKLMSYKVQQWLVEWVKVYKKAKIEI